MSEIEVEDQVPFQEPRRRRSKYPLKDMRVGESFEVDRPTIRPYLSKFMRADPEGRKFATRKVDDSGRVRVWRVS